MFAKVVGRPSLTARRRTVDEIFSCVHNALAGQVPNNSKLTVRMLFIAWPCFRAVLMDQSETHCPVQAGDFGTTLFAGILCN